MSAANERVEEEDPQTKPNRGGRGSRSVPLASTALAVVLVVAVVAVAYGSAAPSLGIAEFSPSAQQAIDAPPPTNAGDSGNGSGGRGGRGRNSTTTTAAAATGSTTEGDQGPGTSIVGRSRRCYGNPPRQSEDPLSPPCVATMFEGLNGGATSKGVSATEIRIGIAGLNSTSGSYVPTIKALIEHFNNTYEFYGRKLVPVFVPMSGGGAERGRALAADLNSANVFAAATGYYEWYNGHSSLAAQLAREGIITVVRGATTWWSDRTLYDQYHPYVWSAFPSLEDMQTHLASFSCRALAGKEAQFAGDAHLKESIRKFGVVAMGDVTPPPTTVLGQILEGCTGTKTVAIQLTPRSQTADRTSAFNKLKEAGVTTMFCVCEGYLAEDMYRVANNVGFHPEWVLAQASTQSGNDEGAVQNMRRYDNMAPPIRVNAGPRLLPTQARPYYPYMQHVLKPGAFLYGEIAMAEFYYYAFLTLASGIQGAGPHLNPESYSAALMNMQFPNPGAGQAPNYQPGIGFGPGDHSLFDDYHVGWWSDTAEAMDLVAGSALQGSWCYLDQAKRYKADTFPTDAESRLFNTSLPCR